MSIHRIKRAEENGKIEFISRDIHFVTSEVRVTSLSEKKTCLS